MTLGEVQKRRKGLSCTREEGSGFGLNDCHCKFIDKTRAQAASLLAVTFTDDHSHGTFPARHLSVSVPHLPPWPESCPTWQPRGLSMLSRAWEPCPKGDGKEFPSGNTAPWEFIVGHPTDRHQLCPRDPVSNGSGSPPFPGSKFPGEAIPPLGLPAF